MNKILAFSYKSREGQSKVNGGKHLQYSTNAPKETIRWTPCLKCGTEPELLEGTKYMDVPCSESELFNQSKDE